MKDILITDVPWTKLKDDGIWAHVSVKYMEPVGRYYHNMEHVVSLYKYARDLKIPHDINLDLAILFHDVVYDAADNKEIRSANVFAQVVKNATGKSYGGGDDEKVMMPFGVVNMSKTIDAILTTINHAPSGDDKEISNIMVMLDLLNFADKDTRKAVFDLLMEEIEVLYPKAERMDVYTNIIANTLRIYGNLVYYVTLADRDGVKLKYRPYWDAIIVGMADQVADIKKTVELGKLNIVRS